MHWFLLILAGLFEVGFTTCFGKAREPNANSAFWFSAFAVCLFFSMFLFYRASLKIPLGTAYAVWTGIGAAGAVLMGIFYFNEAVTFWRMFFLVTLIASVIGLKFVSAG